MTRFAILVATVELALTVGAVWIVALVEAPVATEYLEPDDLRDVGLAPTAFRRDSICLPGAETRHKYWADIGACEFVYVEVRRGASRHDFEEHLREERAFSAKARGDGGLYLAMEEQWSGDESFAIRRVYPSAETGTVNAEIWIRDGASIVVAKVTLVDAPKAALMDRLAECEHAARRVAIMVAGHLGAARAR